MQRGIISLKATWYKWGDYEIVGEFIQPIQGSDIIEYDPFAYFLDYVRTKTPKKILKPSDDSIYGSFANIDTKKPESLLAWVKAYGVPYSMYRKDEGTLLRGFPTIPNVKREHFASHRKEIVDRIQISELMSQVMMFRFLIELHKAFVNPSSENRALIGKWVSSSVFQNHFKFLQNIYDNDSSSGAKEEKARREFEKLWDESLKLPPLTPAQKSRLEDEQNLDVFDAYKNKDEIVQGYIEHALRYATTSVREVSKFKEKQLKTHYEFGSLLALMYKMLSIDWEKKKDLMSCADPKCRRLFIPGSAKTIYCADECRNRVEARKYRQRNKEGLTAQQRKRRAKAKEAVAIKAILENTE